MSSFGLQLLLLGWQPTRVNIIIIIIVIIIIIIVIVMICI